MITYANKLFPQEKIVEEQTRPKTELLQEALKSDDWKKEKVTLIVNKRDKEEDFYPGKSKKNKDKKNSQVQEKGNANASFNHQMEILTYFDHVKVSPPLFTNKLGESIRLLKEKKEYYQNLSQNEQNQTTKPAGETQKNSKEESVIPINLMKNLLICYFYHRKMMIKNHLKSKIRNIIVNLMK